VDIDGGSEERNDQRHPDPDDLALQRTSLAAERTLEP
jgi:hypothetical protein